MNCPSCAHATPDGSLFCDDCGAKLDAERESICAACGAVNQPSARFCMKCGARIGTGSAPAKKPSRSHAATPSTGAVRVTPEQPDASTALEGERKTVTALFADIKGSTELMEELDPEEARAIIDPALKLMIDAAHRYDGYVVQSTGDGIFALFGAPVAHEDHPQRALYAALRLQEDLKRYSAKVVANGSSPIQGRVGINTGEVVVRSIQTGAGQVEYTPIGHTTNLASRMQTAAPVGSIAVSENTRRLCEGYFILKPLGATRVKGVTEPVNVYEVTGLGPLRTRLQRSAGRGLTKFVGREREMEALRHSAEQAKGGRGQIVAAMAEPGVGKSRLLFEFKATSRAGWRVLEAFSVSHGKASAYLPVIDLLRNYFRIAGEDDERTRREKVAGKITILDRNLEDTLPYLFSLLGIVEGEDPLAQMDGQIRKRRTLDAIKRILLRESLNQPLMAIFEDLHWIDEATQEFLNLLADSLGTAKILLLVNYRPEYSHKWNSKTYYTQLRLDPLGQESAEEMLSALLGDGKDLLPLKRLIIERTEGTPFFMEEIVQALFEDGVLQRDSPHPGPLPEGEGSKGKGQRIGAVKLVKSMSAVKVPATVQAILASRIDRLPADEKELLQTLAVIGREFAMSLVRQVVEASKDEELERMLADLQMAEFIYEQPALADIEYTFKHALTQEVAYSSVLIERRKLLHERTAEALEMLFRDRLEDRFSELAYHYSRSGNSRKAVEYLRLAAEQASQRAAYSEAFISASRGLELLNTLSNEPECIQHNVGLQTTLAECLIMLEGFSASARSALERAKQLCEQAGNSAQLFSVLQTLRVVYLSLDLHKARQIAEQALVLAEREKEPAFLAAAYTVGLGQVLLYLGEFAAARNCFERGLATTDNQLRQSGDSGSAPRGAALSLSASVLWFLGYPNQALERIQEALAISRLSSSPYERLTTSAYAGNVYQCLRNGQTLLTQTETILPLAPEQGLPILIARIMMQHGWALADQGRLTEGIAEMERAIEAQKAAGSPAFSSHYCWLAEAYLKDGRFRDGLGSIVEALDMIKERGDRNYEAELHRLKGELLLRQDSSNAAEARNCFERAIEIARRRSAKSWELRATTSLARLLAAHGRRDEARAMLSEIYNWFTEGFDTADLKDAKALLDELQE